MIVIFLDIVSKVNYLVERGVIIHGTFVPVLPLVSPAKRVTISNAPPFIKNEAKEVWPPHFAHKDKGFFGCKAVLLKHVVCHRRQVL